MVARAPGDFLKNCFEVNTKVIANTNNKVSRVFYGGGEGGVQKQQGVTGTQHEKRFYFRFLLLMDWKKEHVIVNFAQINWSMLCCGVTYELWNQTLGSVLVYRFTTADTMD